MPTQSFNIGPLITSASSTFWPQTEQQRDLGEHFCGSQLCSQMTTTRVRAVNHPERDATHEPKFRQEGPEGAETNSIKTKEAGGRRQRGTIL